MFFIVGAGIYISVQTWNPTIIALHAGKVWGHIMFQILVLTMMILAIIQTPFLLPLWLFHMKLCWLTISTGEFHASYMFILDHNKEMRGRSAYLDERNRTVLIRLAEINFMDQASAWRLWLEHHKEKKELKQSRLVVSNMSRFNKRVLEMTSGIRLMPDDPDPARGVCGPEENEKAGKGRQLRASQDDITEGEGDEEDPLLPPNVMPAPPPRPKKQEGILSNCCAPKKDTDPF